MDANDNRQLALQKAISSHEQAAAALNDLLSNASDSRYAEMLTRIEQNIAQLKGHVERSLPGDVV